MQSSRTTQGMGFLRARDISGTRVENAQGENLGNIEDLVIDVDAGRIAYAVLSFGGFLGLGDKNFAIPMKALRLSHHDGGLTPTGCLFSILTKIGSRMRLSSIKIIGRICPIALGATMFTTITATAPTGNLLYCSVTRYHQPDILRVL